MNDYTWFAQILVDADYTPRKYSGRFMYGKQCLSIHLDREDSQARTIGLILANMSMDNKHPARFKQDVLDLSEILQDAREDSMGLGSVLYFPKVTWKDSYENPTGEEEDFDEEDEQKEWEDERTTNALELTCSDSEEISPKG